MLRCAALQRSRGFTVRFAAFEDEAPFDLLLSRGGAEAEVACDVVSAEDGRGVHRGAWLRLVDRIDPDLQIWLAAHPGRYLLKLTLPNGLHGSQENLSALHARIRAMLQTQRRADHDEAAVLRLDPLMLAAAQADELGLMPSLRREFGHEAHLAVTTAGAGVFVLAARAGRENEVAAAIRRRMAAVAPPASPARAPASSPCWSRTPTAPNGVTCATSSNWKARPASSSPTRKRAAWSPSVAPRGWNCSAPAPPTPRPRASCGSAIRPTPRPARPRWRRRCCPRSEPADSALARRPPPRLSFNKV